MVEVLSVRWRCLGTVILSKHGGGGANKARRVVTFEALKRKFLT